MDARKINDLEIIGDPPTLEGLTCEAFICEGYVYKGEPVATANSVYLRFDGRWHKLGIDCGVVFWRKQLETPAPWAVDDEGWQYPHADVGGMAGIIGHRLECYRMEATPAGMEVTFRFDNGRAIVIVNEDDDCSFRIV